MRLLTTLGFEPGGDAMHRRISGLADRLSWLVLVVLLYGWSAYDAMRASVVPTQFVVLSAGLFVYWSVQLLVRRNLIGLPAK